MEHDIKAYAARLSSSSRSSQLTIKRLIDIVGAGCGLLILSPLLLLLALVIRLDSPGPVIFTQKRLGRYGRVFTMYKFRSMRHNAPMQFNRDGSTRVIDNDPRVTRLGHLMRRTGLDELPQLINVILGDMSLVGPRPDPHFYIEHYTIRSDQYKLAMRPGITALAHVRGRQTIPWRDRFAIEREYIETFSLLRDALILCQTVMVIAQGIGVNNTLPATEPARRVVGSVDQLAIKH